MLPVDWIQLAAVVGAVQGFLLAGVLALHRSNRTANRLLAALMATCTIYLLWEVYYSSGLVRQHPRFFGVSYPLPWVFGPLAYLYAVTASDGSRSFRARDARHFLPALIVVLVGLPIYLASGPEKIALYERMQFGDSPPLLRFLNPFKYISGIGYSVATIVYLRRHRRRVELSYSTTERVNLRWLVWLSGAAAAIWLLAVLIGAAGVIPLPLGPNSDDIEALAITALVYAIGYMGLRQPEIFRFDPPSAGTPPAVASVEPTPAEQRDVRYARSGLSDTEASALKTSLITLMTTERPYRDPDLTLPILAEQLSTTPHKLSEVLNAELSQTFYDFVNRYRVEDVQRRLGQPESKHLKMLALAMDAGFASKSTFNEVFKKQTGQTPSTYKKALAG